MAKGPQRFLDAAGHAIRSVTVWLSGLEKDVASSPTITSGTGAPTGTPPDGSQFMSTGAAPLSVRLAGAWVQAGEVRVIADVGDAVAIPVTSSLYMPITTGGVGETNTLAIPTFAGQRMVLSFDVDGGGDRVITAASAINVAGNTIMTFATARQNVELVAIQLAGVLAWEVVGNNGTVALS